jgi:hypothetical protein
MNSITLRGPRMSRAKALFATLGATVALAGGVGAAAPSSASALKATSNSVYCRALLRAANWTYQHVGGEAGDWITFNLYVPACEETVLPEGGPSMTA